MNNRKQYRACACKRPGYCKRYKREMPVEYWELCQHSEKHRMMFDEVAGNFIFGMVTFNDPEKNLLHKVTPEQNEIKRQRWEKKKMDVDSANKAIEELKKEGVDLRQLNPKDDKGLGDTVERVLTKFGLTKELMTKIAGKSCGCSERKKWLNKLLPYGK